MENQEQISQNIRAMKEAGEPISMEGLLWLRVDELENLVVEKLHELEKKVEESLQANADQQRESVKKSLQSVSTMLNKMMTCLGIVITENPKTGAVSYKVPYENPQAVGALVTLTRDVEKMKNGPGILGPNGQRIFTPGDNGTGRQ